MITFSPTERVRLPCPPLLAHRWVGIFLDIVNAIVCLIIFTASTNVFSTQTVFCSRRCQDEAMATYHVTESKFMDVLFQHGLRKKEWFLAIRAVTMKSLAYFLEQGIGEHDPGYGTKDGIVYDGQDFKSLYNLVSHHSEWSFKEHAYKAFFSLFFVRCLQKSNYFGEHQSKEGVGELNKEELLIGTLMIHIMEVATMNAHEIGQMEVEGETNWLLAQTKPVGCALEPTLVLLNHSCDPTLLRLDFFKKEWKAKFFQGEHRHGHPLLCK